MNLRIRFTKENYLKYISHHDLMRLFERTFRRANIPIKYSEGFNPQPKLSIANPLALGIASCSEYMDIELQEKMPEEVFINKVNTQLPEGIRIVEVKYIEETKSLSSLIRWSCYEIEFYAANIKSIEELEESIKNWLKEEKIMVTKVKRKKNRIIEKERNIKNLIGNVIVKLKDTNAERDTKFIVLNCLLRAGDKGNLNPRDFIMAMEKYLNIGIDWDTLEINRVALFIETDGEIQSPI